MADTKEKVRAFYAREVRHGHYLCEGSITHATQPTVFDGLKVDDATKAAGPAPKKGPRPRKTALSGIPASAAIPATQKTIEPELVQVAKPVEGTPNRLAGDLFTVVGQLPVVEDRTVETKVSPYDRTYDIPKEAYVREPEEAPVVPVLEPPVKEAEAEAAADEEHAAPEHKKRRRKRQTEASEPTEDDLAGD